MTITTDWDALVSAALVGTERRPPPGAASGDGRAEARVLAAAAVTGATRRAGWRPGSVAELPAPAPPDDRPVAPPAAVQVLDLLLGGGVWVAGGTRPLVAHWLGRAAERDRRPPARDLPALLELATVDPSLRGPVAGALGARGGWLVAQNAEWSWARPIQPGGWERVMRTGRRPERIAVLRAARRADPRQGRELLAATWKGNSAAERAALLECLAVALSDDDEPWLDDALDDRSRGVRAVAAALLDRLPSSRRAARMAERAGPLVRVKGRARRQLEVELPPEPDAAARRDGVTDDAPAKVGRRTWWFTQIVGAAPLVRWEELGAAAELVPLARRHDALLAGWEHAATAQRNGEWAAALFAELFSPALVAALDPPRAYAIVGDALDRVPDARLAGVLAALVPPWPRRLSAQIARRTDSFTDARAREIAPLLAAGLDASVAALVATRLGVGHALALRQTIDEELR